ncbi:hypothetical protein HMPREF1988_02042 [Porphyromonas gingivalis F0185]|nr:hypothetical protein HMPREF1988_02042 [Porphyromonas gingivalis F0185]
MVVFHTHPFVGEQSLPLHHSHCSNLILIELKIERFDRMPTNRKRKDPPPSSTENTSHSYMHGREPTTPLRSAK